MADVGAIGGGGGSIIGGIGDIFASQDYGKAASLAVNAEQFSAESTALQEYVLNKQIRTGMGSERAAYAGANLKTSGSAIDVLRNTAQLGSLRKSQIQVQGQINELGYQEQALGLESQQSAATAGAISGFTSGIGEMAMGAGG